MQKEEEELKKSMAGAASATAAAPAAATAAQVPDPAAPAASAKAPEAQPQSQVQEPAAEQAEAKADPVAQLQSEVEALKAQLKETEDKAHADLDRMARAAAEAENRRKRAEADVERERKFANEKILKALLPVVDSLDLAMAHTDPNNEALKVTYEGISNTMDLFLKELEKFGVKRIDPKGQPFNPNEHQAVSMVPSNEVKPNCVLNVMQKGFSLNGRVVRPAMVIVAKAPEGQPPKADDGKKDGEQPQQGGTINLEA
jgi:molecular chaperone GrpE